MIGALLLLLLVLFTAIVLRICLKNGTKKQSHTTLTIPSIANAIRDAGYYAEVRGSWISFKTSGEEFFVEADKLPVLFVLRDYPLQTGDFDQNKLEESMRLMSERLVMVKALLSSGKDGAFTLRLFVAAMDRDVSSFRANLDTYIGLICRGRNEIRQIYGR